MIKIMNCALREKNRNWFNHNFSKRGFAIMFAILASTVLLSISISILNLTLRQVIFSSFGRESQIALYAADAGLECALYWEIKNAAFSITDPLAIDCGGGTLPINGVGTVGSPRYNDDILLGANSSLPCVSIKAQKETIGGDIVSKIWSYGHNTCDYTNRTRVERGLLVTF